MTKGVYPRLLVQRECFTCGQKSIFIDNKDIVTWRLNLDESGNEMQSLCISCFRHFIINPVQIPIDSPKRITFLDKRVRLKFVPRKGKCSVCHKKGRTLMHHDEYIETDPLKHTREVCNACHRVIHNTILLDELKSRRCVACDILIPARSKGVAVNRPTKLAVCRRCAYNILGVKNN